MSAVARTSTEAGGLGCGVAGFGYEIAVLVNSTGLSQLAHWGTCHDRVCGGLQPTRQAASRVRVGGPGLPRIPARACERAGFAPHWTPDFRTRPTRLDFPKVGWRLIEARLCPRRRCSSNEP